MRNVIFGGLGVLWGAVIILFSFLKDNTPASGAYGAGQTAGTVLGVVMFGVGLFYLITGIRSQIQGEPIQKPRKRKRKRKPVEDDE
jgi:hypothetical protein